jgi:hypothetical protein
LALINSRYGDLERRVLERLGGAPAGTVLPLPGNTQILVQYLLKDGLAVLRELPPGSPGISIGGRSMEIYIQLTPKGRLFARRYEQAEPLEDGP